MNTLRNLFKSCIILALCAVTGASTLHSQSAWCPSPPGHIQGGGFENCQFDDLNCMCSTFVNLSSGGWHVSHGTPSESQPPSSGNMAVQLIANHNSSGSRHITEGMFNCVDILPNTSYVLQYDARTDVDASPGILRIEAATGLVPWCTGCQNWEQTPTTRQFIQQNMVSNTNWQTFTTCFTTGDTGFDQLWLHGQWPFSATTFANTSVSIDNVRLCRTDEFAFHLLLNSNVGPTVTACEGPQNDHVWLQYVSHNHGCTEGIMKVTIYSSGPTASAQLTAAEQQQILLGQLDLTTIDFGGFFYNFVAGECYDIVVEHWPTCGGYSSSAITYCVEDCLCDFDGLEIYYTWVTIYGEDNMTLTPPSAPHMIMAGALWDFGDGTTANGLYFQRKFPDGTYTICVTVYFIDARNGECCDTTICFEHTVEWGQVLKAQQETGPGAEASRPADNRPGDEFARPRSSLHPNPFAQNARLNYSVEADEEPVSIELYDAQGRLLRTLLDKQPQSHGRHQMEIDAGDLAGGVYFVKIRQGLKIESLKLHVRK